MIRNPIKIGTVQASNNGIEHLPIPVGHNGTISHLLFLFYVGDQLVNNSADVIQALDHITLDATNPTEGNFTILNEVTPAFLEYREARARVSSTPVPLPGILQYDPAIGLYKDEFLRNERTLGCADLSSMGLRFDFSGQVGEASVDRIEVWMDVDYNLIQPLGEHVRIDRLTQMVPGAGGKVEISELPKMDSRFGYLALHLECHADDIADNRIGVDEVTIIINGNQYP